MFDKSFITLHRKIISSACFADAELLKVWLWCLIRANHSDKEVVHAGQIISLKRGQFITGRFTASKELNMSADKYRKRIATLVLLKQITQKTTNKYTVITIEKYNDYQSKVEKTPNKTPTKPQQNPTDNNVNNENKLGETSSPSLPTKEEDMWNNKSDDFEEGVIDLDGDGSLKPEKKPQTRKYPNAPAIRKVFQEVLGKNPADWNKNTTVLQACENLYTERGVEKVRNALEFYKENKEREYCPIISTPVDLDRKYEKLGLFKKSS
jgi:archaellum component FlaD/FlaE